TPFKAEFFKRLKEFNNCRSIRSIKNALILLKSDIKKYKAKKKVIKFKENVPVLEIIHPVDETVCVSKLLLKFWMKFKRFSVIFSSNSTAGPGKITTCLAIQVSNSSKAETIFDQLS